MAWGMLSGIVNAQIMGACSWSIDRHDCLRAIAVAAEAIGLAHLQVGFFTEAALSTADAPTIRAAAARSGVTISSTFAAFEGEDYSSIATIAATGGLMNDTEWEHRLGIIQRVAALAARLGCASVATHIGTIPNDPDAPDYAKLLTRTRIAADALAALGVRLLLETGREPAAMLTAFLNALDRPNVAVNFDGANFVVYGTDDPVRATVELKGRIEGVHLKDGVSSPRPGVDFGRAAPLGAGEVNIPRVLSKLRAAGYAGPMWIEVAGPGDHTEAIRSAAAYLRTMWE